MKYTPVRKSLMSKKSWFASKFFAQRPKQSLIAIDFGAVSTPVIRNVLEVGFGFITISWVAIPLFSVPRLAQKLKTGKAVFEALKLKKLRFSL